MATSGSFESYEGKISSGTEAGAKLVFEWSSEEKSPGQTKVSWTLKATGREGSPTWFTTICSLKIGSEEVYSANNKNLYYTDNTYASGTFVVKHDKDGAGSFTAKLTVNKIGYNTESKEFGGKQELDNSAPFTKCGAPTKVTISKPILVPGGTMTVKWEGAKDGTANKITGYQIWYKIGSGSWSSSVSVNDPEADNCTITLPTTAARGANVQACVRAIGTKSGYDSEDAYSDTTASKINTLPKQPTITVSSTRIPSSSNGVTLTATAGSSGDSSQTAVVRYGTSSNPEDSNVLTGKLPIKETITYYFWTYDGLEYSSPVKKEFIKNTKPEVSIDVSGTDLKSVNKLENANYVITPTIKVEASGGQSGSNTYKYYVRYSAKFDFSNSSTLLLDTKTSKQYKISDIRQYVPVSASRGYYYKLGVKRNDGIESTSIQWSEQPYCVTKIPVCKAFCNNNSVEDKGKSKYFSTDLRFYYDQDAGYTKLELQARQPVKDKDDSGAIKKTLLASFHDSQVEGQMLAILDVSSLEAGEAYNFYARPKSANFTPSDPSNLGTKTKIKSAPSFTPVWSGAVNPYTTPSQKVTFLNFFKAEYGFDASNTKATVIAKYGSKSSSISGILVQPTGSNDTCEITLTGENYMALFDGLGIDKNQNTSTAVNITLQFENVFGEKATGNFKKNVKFVTDGTRPETGSYKSLLIGGKSFTATFSSAYIFEGLSILLSEGLLVKSYHGVPVQATLELKSGNKVVLTQTTDSIKASNSSSQKVGYKTPITYILEQLDFGQMPFNETGDYSITSIVLTLYTQAGQSVQKIYSCNTNATVTYLKFTTPTVTITSTDYTSGTAEVKYTATSGVKINTSNVEQTFELQAYQGKWNTLISTDDKTARMLSKTTNLPNSKILKVRIKATTKIKQLTSTNPQYIEKVAYSTASFVQDIMPTVAYRKNAVGINHNFPGKMFTSPAFIVRQYASDHKFVYFSNANGKKIITFDLENGSIDGATIDGATIDGGTWDEI